MSIWFYIIIIVVSILIYEFIIRSFLLRREIRIVEKRMNKNISMVQKVSLLHKSHMKNVLDIYQLYKKTDFKIPWIWLQLHIMQLMYSYVFCILQLTCRDGAMFCWDDIHDISSLSERKKQLELTLKNLLIYINKLDE